MKQRNLKKLLIPNIPYAVIGLYATKLGQAARFAPGTDFSSKAIHFIEGMTQAFASPWPSFHPSDLVVGILCGLGLRLAVYLKGKNAKKYRKNVEYGSARWGNHEDIPNTALTEKPMMQTALLSVQAIARCTVTVRCTLSKHRFWKRWHWMPFRK